MAKGMSARSAPRPGAGQALPHLPPSRIFRNPWGMQEQGLSEALDRAEAALERIERSLSASDRERGRDETLRARVREAVAELDQLIRAANG